MEGVVRFLEQSSNADTIDTQWWTSFVHLHHDTEQKL